MAFENSRKLSRKQNRHKILADECNQLKVVAPDLNSPLCNPPPNVIWSPWPRHVLLMIGHLEVLNVITINIVIVIATIAMIGQLPYLTIIMVIAKHHLLSISDQPMLKEEQTKS